MKYYIVAGERSGDLHGGNLVRALRKEDPQGTFRGFGGEYMKDAGVDVVVHYADMAFMGLAELLGNLRKISRYIRKCKDDIDQFNPDVVILIDYGGFNRRIAKYGRSRGLKIFYYIPPKVWAWYQRRVWELKANVDRMFVILPFEKDFYRKFHWEVDYVGNPVLDAVRAHTPDDQFREREGLTNDKPIVALLPGSRKQELQRIIPIMEEVVRRNPSYQYAVAAVDNLDSSLYGELRSMGNVKFVYNKTYDLLQHAAAAIVTSGTATLETALFRVPQVVVYKASPLSYFLARLVVKVSHISLVNLIAGREVVRELIQGDANPSDTAAELERLLQGERRNKVLEGYEEVVRLLDAGDSASENAARLMVRYLRA
jgi:lipid-A-disaccharide synthase